MYRLSQTDFGPSSWYILFTKDRAVAVVYPDFFLFHRAVENGLTSFRIFEIQLFYRPPTIDEKTPHSALA